MNGLYTHGGIYFGWRDNDSLFSHHGIEAGRFYDNEIYDKDGSYLGELRNNKLITDEHKARKRQSRFTPTRFRGLVPYCDLQGLQMISGYTDFPSPDNFK